jgi:hypothetical protein
MAYPLSSAMFQWDTGSRRLRDLPAGRDRQASERRVNLVVDELRRRLGSTFTLEELADFYGEGTSWADALSGSESLLVDAAFARYAREAKNYAGGTVRAAG